MTPDRTPETHVVLVPGYWLGAWAWDDVLPPLRAAGLTPHAVALPGQGPDDRSAATLDDHVAAVRELVDDLEGDVVLVGHSGGAPVVQMVTDQRPERVGRTIYVDAGPMRDGVALFPDTPSEIGHVTFPDDAHLAAAGLSPEGVDLAALRSRAVPQPTGVMRSPVRVGTVAGSRCR
jgi:pimeloyl-ACP methyl ester carboxylesterase